MTPWRVEPSDIFVASVAELKKLCPDLPARVARFLEVKRENPLAMRYGKSDYPMTGPMIGFQHCHLAPDVILLYTLTGRALNLITVCQHADIEGKRVKGMAKRLAAYRA